MITAAIFMIAAVHGGSPSDRTSRTNGTALLVFYLHRRSISWEWAPR